MRPGRTALTALLGLACLALLVPRWPGLTTWLWGGLGFVVAAMLVERLLLGRVVLRLERSPRSVLSIDEPHTLTHSLVTEASGPLRLTVRQLWPRLVEARSTTRTGIARPGEPLRLEFPLRALMRGSETLAPLWVALTRWGWAERIAEVGPPTLLTVLPNLKAVQRLHQKLNWFVLRGLGSRVSPRLGKGREFDRLREYVQDDDFRDIAWKASAHHGKLIVREYRLDRAQDVLLCVDRGHRMAARTTRITRMDHAVNAAVLLGYICHRMEDRVGILSFAAEVERGLAQGKGTVQLRELTDFATGIRAEYIHTDYLALAAHVKRRLLTRALILLLTTLPEKEDGESLLRAVRMLVPQHLPLIVVLSDPALAAAATLLPADGDELCRALVARDLWNGQREVIQELRRRGAWVVEAPPEEAGVEAVNSYLEIKRRQLL